MNRWLFSDVPVVSAGRAKGELGNLAYDISLSLHYDPVLKLLILLGNAQQEIMVTRIDPATLKTFGVKLVKPKKK